MGKRIAIIQGHPTPQGSHLDHALASAYMEGAKTAGHEVRLISVADLDFPLLHTREDWEKGQPPEVIRDAQELIGWADHLVIIYPLWLGAMPAMLKAFFEQVFRPGFAFARSEKRLIGKKLLKGRSARVVISMGMPAFLYRWFYRAHSLKALKRNMLAFVGIGPVKTNLFGMVESGSNTRRTKWLAKMYTLGRKGA